MKTQAWQLPFPAALAILLVAAAAATVAAPAAAVPPAAGATVRRLAALQRHGAASLSDKKDDGHGEVHHEEPIHGHEESHDHDHGHAAHEGHARDMEHEHHGHEEERGQRHGATGDHAEPHDGGHGQAHSHQEATTVATGLIASSILIPVTLSMLLAEGRVGELSLKMVDTFVSIFLAVLWFNTFNQFLLTFEVTRLFPLAAELVGLVQVVVLYAIANGVAYLFKDNNMRVATFCSCGAHFIAFAGISVAGPAQRKSDQIGDDTYENAGLFAVFVFVAIVLAFLMAMFMLNETVWRASPAVKEAHTMHESIEEMELDIVGLVISFLITQGVRAAITGQIPAAHLLLQLLTGSEGQHAPHGTHQPWQRWFMLIWAVVLAAVAICSMPLLNDLSKQSPTLSKLTHVAKVILIMLVAWGFLLWGQWEFFENLFAGDPLFGQMVFACSSTMVCLLVLYCMGRFSSATPTAQSRQTFDITTTGISLVAAWSWEHCFDTAFDIFGEQHQVGYKGLVPKVVLSIVVPAALLPLYLGHVRPRVMEINEKYEHEHEGAEGHGAGHAGHGTPHAVHDTEHGAAAPAHA